MSERLLMGNGRMARLIKIVSISLYVPTLTAVFPSSSDARLPPGLLPTLNRLWLRGGRIIALKGRCIPLRGGEPGGEFVIAQQCQVFYVIPPRVLTSPRKQRE